MKKQRSKSFLIFFLILTMVFQTVSSAFVYAAGELKPEVTVTDFKIVNQKTEYSAWESFDLSLKWDASTYQNKLTEGDYFEIKLPDNMVFPNDSAATKFQLLDDEGKVVANAVVTPNDDGGGNIKATFTNYVKDKYNIKGTMKLAARFAQNKLDYGKENSFTIVVGKTTKQIKIKIKDVIGNSDIQLDKWGEAVKDNDNMMQWDIRINHNKGALVNLKIDDEILTGETIDPNSFKLWSMYWNKYSAYGGAKEIEEPLNIKIDDNKKSFTCDLSNIVPFIAVTDADNVKLVRWEKSTRPAGDLTGAQLYLTYRTTYTPGTKATNKVVGTSITWGESKVYTSTYQSASSGGTGQGNKGKVKIIKTDAVDKNIKLPQAEFEIRIKDTDELIETMITGNNGEAISKKTLDPTKKYILKEVSTPPGYEVSSTSENLEFVPDLNKLTDVAVENKRILTNISGEKTWINDELYNVRPKEIVIQLVADGVEVPGKTLTVTPDQDGKWKYEFKDIPKFRTDKRDENGKDIPIVYTVKEVVVPEGYTSQVEGMNVKNTYTPKEFNFKFKKTDVAGKELAGAKIEVSSVDKRPLINNNGNKVPSVEWISDGNAKELTLEAGKYTFVEKAAPEGFVIATTINFTVNPDGTVTGTNVKVEGPSTIIVMVDDYKYHPITISKTDLGGQELPGAKITIKSSDGSELIKDDNGKKVADITFESTDVAKEIQVLPGKYVFHEESAPKGYLTVTDIEFEVDKDGKVTVLKVAEDDIVKAEGNKVAITDRKVPEVKTEAKVNDKKEDAPTEKVVLTDVVKYSNLIVGKTYKAKLVWMDKATGNPFLIDGQPVTAEKTFVAEKENGEVELSVTVDAKHFVKDETLVAFEEVYKDNILVAAHKDLNDKDQTVKVKQPKPKLKTLAKVNDKKEAILKDKITLTDCVDYTDLVVGKEYTVKLVWMDKASGKEVLVDGKPLTAEKTFVAEKSNGQVELSVVVDAKYLKQGKLVAFETMYEKGQEVAAHKDINDVDQTVLLKKPILPKTNISSSLSLYANMLLASGSLLAILDSKRRKKSK